jgi:hypothetical protein
MTTSEDGWGLATAPNFRESDRAATVTERLPGIADLFGSGYAGLGNGRDELRLGPVSQRTGAIS